MTAQTKCLACLVMTSSHALVRSLLSYDRYHPGRDRAITCSPPRHLTWRARPRLFKRLLVLHHGRKALSAHFLIHQLRDAHEWRDHVARTSHQLWTMTLGVARFLRTWWWGNGFPSNTVTTLTYVMTAPLARFALLNQTRALWRFLTLHCD